MALVLSSGKNTNSLVGVAISASLLPPGLSALREQGGRGGGAPFASGVTAPGPVRPAPTAHCSFGDGQTAPPPPPPGRGPNHRYPLRRALQCTPAHSLPLVCRPSSHPHFFFVILREFFGNFFEIFFGFVCGMFCNCPKKNLKIPNKKKNCTRPPRPTPNGCCPSAPPPPHPREHHITGTGEGPTPSWPCRSRRPDPQVHQHAPSPPPGASWWSGRTPCPSRAGPGELAEAVPDGAGPSPGRCGGGPNVCLGHAHGLRHVRLGVRTGGGGGYVDQRQAVEGLTFV